jgi:adenine-specific DNA methylase
MNKYTENAFQMALDQFALEPQEFMPEIGAGATEEYFYASFQEQLDKVLNTISVWEKVMAEAKTQEDRDNALRVFNTYLEEKLVRLGL